MDCRTCQLLLCEYALGQLAETERAGIEHHLAGGCAACRRELREVEAAWVALVDALPPADVPERLQAALRERIAAGPPRVNNARQPVRAAFTPERDEVARGEHRSVPRLAWVMAAGVLLALTIGGVAWLSEQNAEWGAYRQEAAQRAREMERLQAELSEANEVFAGGRLHFASLREGGPQTAVRGYVVWDRLSRQIHFYVFDLPALPADRVHRVWLTGEEAGPIAAGTLAPQENGTGSTLLDVPDELGDAFRVLVVEGPQTPPTEPAGEPWLMTEVR